MDIKRLHLFDKNLLQKIDLIYESAISSAVFYVQGKKWLAMDGQPVTDRGLRSCLDQTKRADSLVFRPKRESTAYFWITRLDAVAQIKFNVAIKSRAQLKVSKRIQQIRDDSLNEYSATHDAHTGLGNRGAFDQALNTALETARSTSLALAPGPINEAAALSDNKTSVILASLDIDHFKTINDRFGHGYGDLVLAALARRLEVKAKKLELEFSNRCAIRIYRLGGEEFQILMTGSISDQEGVNVSASLSAEIREQPLPSNEEFSVLKEMEFADGATLPHEADRRVTVSIGVASAPVSSNEKLDGLAKNLKRQADLALYSAKIGGRDCVRFFAEILNYYGRLNQIDKINGVISIDIGREVGVKKGQEFFVYPPSYDGNTPFYIGEGRSRKRVGTFPKFRSARISTFNVQNEVSFCRLIKKEDGVLELTEGSTLEAIPLGSIAHLVAGLDGDQKFMEQGSFRGVIGEMASDSGLVVLAVSIRDLERISEERGIDRANECLGAVGQRVLTTFGSGVTCCQANINSIVVALRADDEDAAKEAVDSLWDSLGPDLGDDVMYGLGWAFKPEGAIAVDLPLLGDAGGLVDAALLAATIEESAHEPHEFSARALELALFASRQQKQYNRAIADYKLFAEMGVASPQVETQIAFVYMGGLAGTLDLAEPHLRRAASMDGATETMKANLGGYFILRGDMHEGFRIVRDLNLIPSYLAARFFAAHEVLPPDQYEQFVAERIDEAKTALNVRQVWLNSSRLEKAIALLQQAVDTE